MRKRDSIMEKGRKTVAARFILLFITVFLFSLVVSWGLLAAPNELVYVIPIEKTIEPGLAKFIERGYREASELGADMVLLEIDTPGGRVDAALEIKDIIQESAISSTALVKGGAISAGSLIALSCETIAMAPGSTIGDAEPRVGSEKADEKYVSYFAKEMAGTASIYGRDPDIAIAMVDRDKVIPGLVEKGKLLTLTYLEAEKYGYTDYLVEDRNELLTELGFSEAQVVEAQPSLAERLSRLVTNPYIAPFLLTLGIAGIVIEVFTFGWGIAGTIGVLSLALYFGGHFLAGFTGWEAILLFLLGIILLGVEIVAPGFGLPGLGGILSIIISIVLTAPSWETGMISLVIAILGTIVLLTISLRLLNKRNFWSNIVLDHKYKKEEGYIPQTKDLTQYVGKTGVAHTTLRPAGTVLLEDGTRLDVVTEGGYIAKGEEVEVIEAEGLRVVVRSRVKK